MRTFRSEAGIGEVIRFGSGLADLEFRFLRGVNGLVIAKRGVWVLTWKSCCLSFFLLALAPMVAVFGDLLLQSFRDFFLVWRDPRDTDNGLRCQVTAIGNWSIEYFGSRIEAMNVIDQEFGMRYILEGQN